MYTVEFSTAARRQFRKLPRNVQAIISAGDWCVGGGTRPHGVEKMSGEENAHRVRVGDSRIIYEIHDTVLIVVVVRVGHRREVYR